MSEDEETSRVRFENLVDCYHPQPYQEEMEIHPPSSHAWKRDNAKLKYGSKHTACSNVSSTSHLVKLTGSTSTKSSSSTVNRQPMRLRKTESLVSRITAAMSQERATPRRLTKSSLSKNKLASRTRSKSILREISQAGSSKMTPYQRTLSASSDLIQHKGVHTEAYHRKTFVKPKISSHSSVMRHSKSGSVIGTHRIIRRIRRHAMVAPSHRTKRTSSKGRSVSAGTNSKIVTQSIATISAEHLKPSQREPAKSFAMLHKRVNASAKSQKTLVKHKTSSHSTMSRCIASGSGIGTHRNLRVSSHAMATPRRRTIRRSGKGKPVSTASKITMQSSVATSADQLTPSHRTLSVRSEEIQHKQVRAGARHRKTLLKRKASSLTSVTGHSSIGNVTGTRSIAKIQSHSIVASSRRRSKSSSSKGKKVSKRKSKVIRKGRKPKVKTLSKQRKLQKAPRRKYGAGGTVSVSYSITRARIPKPRRRVKPKRGTGKMASDATPIIFQIIIADADFKTPKELQVYRISRGGKAQRPRKTLVSSFYLKSSVDVANRRNRKMRGEMVCQYQDNTANAYKRRKRTTTKTVKRKGASARKTERGQKEKLVRKIAGMRAEAQANVRVSAGREMKMLAAKAAAEKKRLKEEEAQLVQKRHERKMKELSEKREELTNMEYEANLHNLAVAKVSIIEEEYLENVKHVEDSANAEQMKIDAEMKQRLAEIELEMAKRT